MESNVWFSDGELFVSDVMLGKYKRQILTNHGCKYQGEKEQLEDKMFLDFIESDYFKRLNKRFTINSVFDEV